MDINAKVTVPSQVMDRQIGDEVVLLELASGTYFGLDAVGARIWQLLSSGKTLAEARDAIHEEFDIDRDAAERDLLAFVAELQSRELIVQPPQA